MSKKPRPTRADLCSRFFPELMQVNSATLGDKEAAIGINQRATEAILGDFIQLFDKGYAAYGPGVLTVRLARDAASKESDYLSLKDLQEDAATAREFNDTDIADALTKAIDTIVGFNTEKAVLLLLIDSGFRLFPIERDNPSKAIVAMMEDMQK